MLSILLTDTILEAMNRNILTALVLLDLSKAFDSINHGRLLKNYQMSAHLQQQ